MDIIRFNLRIATITKNGNCIEYHENTQYNIEYSHDGERRRLKTPDDIRAIVEEMIKIAFPQEERSPHHPSPPEALPGYGQDEMAR